MCVLWAQVLEVLRLLEHDMLKVIIVPGRKKEIRRELTVEENTRNSSEPKFKERKRKKNERREITVEENRRK